MQCRLSMSMHACTRTIKNQKTNRKLKRLQDDVAGDHAIKTHPPAWQRARRIDHVCTLCDYCGSCLRCSRRATRCTTSAAPWVCWLSSQLRPLAPSGPRRSLTPRVNETPCKRHLCQRQNTKNLKQQSKRRLVPFPHARRP